MSDRFFNKRRAQDEKVVEKVLSVPIQHQMTTNIKEGTMMKLYKLWSPTYKRRFDDLRYNNPQATLTQIVNHIFYQDKLKAQQHQYCGDEACKIKLCPYLKSLECYT